MKLLINCVSTILSRPARQSPSRSVGRFSEPQTGCARGPPYWVVSRATRHGGPITAVFRWVTGDAGAVRRVALDCSALDARQNTKTTPGASSPRPNNASLRREVHLFCGYGHVATAMRLGMRGCARDRPGSARGARVRNSRCTKIFTLRRISGK